MAKTPGTSGGQRGRPRVVLFDFTEEDQRPDVAVYAVDRSLKPLHVAPVGDDGSFDLPERALKDAYLVVVGPVMDKPDRVPREGTVQYRVGHFRELVAAGADLEIGRADWLSWLQVRRCVHGSVRHCRLGPWITDLVWAAELQPLGRATAAAGLQIQSLTSLRDSSSAVARRFSALSDHAIAVGQLRPHLPYRCEVVCDGIVEVYRRTCCCKPWIVDDPRLPELVDILERFPPWPPEIKWPPRPGPDPVPWKDLPIIADGTLNEIALSAQADLQALRSLPAAEKAAYVQARPHLFCLLSCGPATKVAQGPIQPSGAFHLCWTEPLRLLLPHCHDEFAYVVRQNIGGVVVTVYNGLAANKWFHYGDNPVLTSYHPLAQGCRHNDFPGDGAFALLQDIGDTGSWHLKTPAAASWDAVAAPGYNDGLVFPAPNPAAAKGKYLDRNWGGTLPLRYHFSEDMKGAGAIYYRISVCAADGNGGPTGSRHYLQGGLSWLKYTGIAEVASVGIGPQTVGGTPYLYQIPYDVDADWQSGQYHGFLDTTDFANGRHLLTLELFNAAGQQIKPAGSPGPGTNAPFTFRRWYQETGPTANVPFAALTHMLWWDNRPSTALIVDLRKNGVASTSECQFLIGPDGAQFSAGYRAYHPNPMFILDHSMWWRRGLGGPWGYLVDHDPDNAGQFGPPAVSGSASFAAMLGPHSKCSFSLNLHVNVKTFNGSVTLTGLNDNDQAAFALEKTGP